ncbi:tetratricopeptide repeat protein [Noviherbaspirillum sp.]|uniref:tetratricopeptide repeat protein n=1 Tax=Noviherbaspirillum sp. TaxID=1926288 RepID=UPI002B475FD2|nr:tetratricopeptide repeat protein [Noviherbaspirillum sp.]HJV82740.1 tetratricopeptide repeat protein [Noviherbaspirillum sp.]
MPIPKSSGRQHSPRAVRYCIGAMVLTASVLAGCAATPPGGEKGNVDLLYKDADTELAKGQNEKAVALLNRAAKENPTSIVPWLKMANIWFEMGNYPPAIVAANEVLRRDEANQEAKSVLVVAGLRVAAGAVAGLRPNGAVNMSARLEAENLTNSLRGVLGEKVLVPAGGSEGKSASAAPRPKSHARSAATTRISKAPQGNPDASSTDPFKSLK